MKQQLGKFLGLCLLACTMALTVYAEGVDWSVKYLHNGQSLVRLHKSGKYLLLPIEEKAPEAQVNLLVDNHTVSTMNVRLAVDKVDYFVPYECGSYNPQSMLLDIRGVDSKAICWKEMKLSDTFDKQNTEKHRPQYHFTPEYGWMNDPNGMVYKDGEYH